MPDFNCATNSGSNFAGGVSCMSDTRGSSLPNVSRSFGPSATQEASSPTRAMPLPPETWQLSITPPNFRQKLTTTASTPWTHTFLTDSLRLCQRFLRPQSCRSTSSIGLLHSIKVNLSTRAASAGPPFCFFYLPNRLRQVQDSQIVIRFKLNVMIAGEGRARLNECQRISRRHHSIVFAANKPSGGRVNAVRPAEATPIWCGWKSP